MVEIYASTDIESTGPIPGPNSMLSFGTVMLDSNGKVLGTYEARLLELEGAEYDPHTLKWWGQNKEAWEEAKRDPKPADIVMPEYCNWLESFNTPVVFVGYPAGFDFLFVYWYLMKFAGRSPFSFSALDIKTYAMALLNTEFKKTTKKVFPKEWFSKRKHTHKALDDAFEQGELFINMLNWET